VEADCLEPPPVATEDEIVENPRPETEKADFADALVGYEFQDWGDREDCRGVGRGVGTFRVRDDKPEDKRRIPVLFGVFYC